MTQEQKTALEPAELQLCAGGAGRASGRGRDGHGPGMKQSSLQSADKQLRLSLSQYGVGVAFYR